MRKSIVVLALLAAATSVAAAKDPRQEKKATAPAASATQLTESEMDKVTAGAGNAWAFGKNEGPGYLSNHGKALQAPGHTK